MISLLASFKRSLGTQFSVFIGALLIPLFIITGIVIISIQSEAFHNLSGEVKGAFTNIREINITAAKKEDSEKIEKLGNLLAAIAPAAIASYDFTSLVKYAQTASETPGVCQIIYKTPDGKTMAEAKTKDFTNCAGTKDFPIVNEGSKMGSVMIGFHGKLLEEKIAQMDSEFSEKEAFLNGVQHLALKKIGITIAGSLMLVSILTLGAIIFLFKRSIASPIHTSVEYMGKLADGILNIDIKYKDRQDEIGSIARALEIFKRNGIEREELQKHEKEKDEIARLRAQKITELSTLFDTGVRDFFHDLETAIASLESASTELTELTQATTARTAAISTSSQMVNQSVSTVAQASEELSGSIREISQQINASTQLIHKTVDQTSKTAEQSELLMSYAQKVNGVLDLISNISHQTRLLSLNATIEAERAGDMGKGFAVVAGEVRVLASQTEDSVKQIQQTITDVQNASSHISEALDQTKKNVDAVNNASSIMSGAADKQSTVTSGISRTMQDAARATNDVAQSLEQIAQAVAKTSTASTSVNEATSTLSQKAHLLRRNVEEFLSEIKRA